MAALQQEHDLRRGRRVVHGVAHPLALGGGLCVQHKVQVHVQRLAGLALVRVNTHDALHVQAADANGVELSGGSHLRERIRLR